MEKKRRTICISDSSFENSIRLIFNLENTTINKWFRSLWPYMPYMQRILIRHKSQTYLPCNSVLNIFPRKVCILFRVSNIFPRKDCILFRVSNIFHRKVYLFFLEFPIFFIEKFTYSF